MCRRYFLFIIIVKRTTVGLTLQFKQSGGQISISFLLIFDEVLFIDTGFSKLWVYRIIGMFLKPMLRLLWLGFVGSDALVKVTKSHLIISRQ